MNERLAVSHGCPKCCNLVKPIVIERKPLTIRVQCPMCGTPWHIKKVKGRIADAT